MHVKGLQVQEMSPTRAVGREDYEKDSRLAVKLYEFVFFSLSHFKDCVLKLHATQQTRLTANPVHNNSYVKSLQRSRFSLLSKSLILAKCF